jgi:hypothetical protein
MSINWNFSAQDALTATTLVGLSRVVEISYSSSPYGNFIGNFLSTAQLSTSLGTGSRIPEVAYTSNPVAPS